AMPVGIGELPGVAEQAQPIAVAADGLLDLADLVTRHACSRMAPPGKPAHRHATPLAPARGISAIAHRLLMRLSGGDGKLQPSFDRRRTAMAGNRLRIAIWGLAAGLW